MKTHLLYAPVLLLGLSVACSKTDKKSPRDVIEQIKATHAEALNIAAGNGSSNPALVAAISPAAADEVHPAAPEPAPADAPLAPAASTPAPVEEEVVDPLPAESPSPEADAGDSRESGLTTGVESVDAICSKSFSGLEALINGDEATFATVKLTVAGNTACYNMLVSSTGKIYDELRMLGVPYTFNLGSIVTLGSGNWSTFASNAGLVPAFMDITTSILNSEKNDNFADANERLDYLKITLAEYAERDPQTLTDSEMQEIMIFQSALVDQQEMVDRINQRIAKLSSLNVFMQFGLAISQVDQYLNSLPAVAPN